MGFKSLLSRARNFGRQLQKGIGEGGRLLQKGSNAALGAIDGLARVEPGLVNNPLGNAVRGALNIGRDVGSLGRAIGDARSFNDVVPAINSAGNSIAANSAAIGTGLATAALL